MITSIEIEAFRGIPHLKLDELGRLVVLVGPNGSGKSTVLEAMLIAASRSPGDAVGRAVQRRVELWHGARWLFPGGRASDVNPSITIQMEGRGTRTTRLRLLSEISAENEKSLLEARKPGPFTEIEAKTEAGGKTVTTWTAFSFQENYYTFWQKGAAALQDGPQVKFIEPKPGARHASLAKVYSDALADGREAELNALIDDVMPRSPRLAVLVDDTNAPVLHFVYGNGTVPVTISGEGIATLARLACELALPAGSTALVEEPEVHQHPRAMRQSARAIVAAARRGVQVVLSTHSLELMDDLLDALESDLHLMTLYMVAKRKGEVVAARHAGPGAKLLRDSIGEDFR
jgi:energy-coupling factor transporter ATP-binding protein EcfA2